MKPRKLGHIGDVNPIEHGGGYILLTNDGDPWLEYFEGIDCADLDILEGWEVELDCPEHQQKVKVTLYRCDIPKSDSDFVAEFDWIDWGSIERFIGEDLKIGNIHQRAQAIKDIASYHGWRELDNYPLELTLGELIERWKEY